MTGNKDTVKDMVPDMYFTAGGCKIHLHRMKSLHWVAKITKNGKVEHTTEKQWLVLDAIKLAASYVEVPYIAWKEEDDGTRRVSRQVTHRKD